MNHSDHNRNFRQAGLCADGLPFGKVGMGPDWLVVVQRQSPLLKLYPIQIFRRYPMLFHRNTIINRANKLAEIAADTFFFFYCIGIIRFAIFKIDGLMRCIFTGNITKPAMNTFILVDLGDMMIIDIKIFPMRNA